MPLPAATVTALQALIDNNPGLHAQLATAGSREQAAALLADAVRANASQPAAAPDGVAPLDESQLNAVSGGFISLDDQFRGLPMSQLIGGPLDSAAYMQARLAATTKAFIDQIGLTF